MIWVVACHKEVMVGPGASPVENLWSRMLLIFWLSCQINFYPSPLPPAVVLLSETPSFLRLLVDRTVANGETAVLQCIAGGSPPPRLNWTKDDSPLVVTERHFFAAANQLLIIVDAAEADAGKYTCEMSNALGTERGDIRLAVMPNPNCDSGVQGGMGAGMVSGPGSNGDGWTTVGIVIIAVVCCVVGTSLVWVVIIYHTRRCSEDCSVTNTGQTGFDLLFFFFF